MDPIITRMNGCRLEGGLENQGARKIGFINTATLGEGGEGEEYEFLVDRFSFEGKIVAKCPEP